MTWWLETVTDLTLELGPVLSLSLGLLNSLKLDQSTKNLMNHTATHDKDVQGKRKKAHSMLLVEKLSAQHGFNAYIICHDNQEVPNGSFI